MRGENDNEMKAGARSVSQRTDISGCRQTKEEKIDQIIERF